MGSGRPRAARSEEFLNAYFVDNRQRLGRDRLFDHVYNFGSADQPYRVEFFSNEPGALISYWDSSYTDNNVGHHPGAGEVLPVDAHPEFTHTPDGAIARPRTLAYDATFSLKKSTTQRLHLQDNPFTLRAPAGRGRVRRHPRLVVRQRRAQHRAHPGHFQPGWFSVDVPETGTTIRVVKVDTKGLMTVRVGKSG